MPRVEHNAPELTEEQLTERLRRAPWRRFAALGDSLTEGLGDPVEGYPNRPWVPLVNERFRSLHPDFETLNLGKRYLTAAQVRETQLEPALEFGPDLASVLAGGNDLGGDPFDPEGVERDIDAMVAQLTEAGATVFTFSIMNITSSGLYAKEMCDFVLPRMQAIRDAVARVSERYDTIFFDYFDHPMAADPSVYSDDLLHTNMKGHALLAERIVQGLAAQVPAAAAAS